MTPRRPPRPKYRETSVSGHVRALMAPSCVAMYVTEVGGTSYRTKGTAGYPDLTMLVRDPEPYTLMVETKGHATAIEETQWRFQAEAALVGQPCLIVRSPGAFLNGLKLLGLLPDRIARMPSLFWDQWDMRELPENVNYIGEMRARFWTARGLPENAGPITLPPGSEAVAARRRSPPWPLGPRWR